MWTERVPLSPSIDTYGHLCITILWSLRYAIRSIKCKDRTDVRCTTLAYQRIHHPGPTCFDRVLGLASPSRSTAVAEDELTQAICAHSTETRLPRDSPASNTDLRDS